MQHAIDLKVLLNPRHEFEDGWSLQERDHDGKLVGSDLMPVSGLLSFTATELALYESHILPPDVDQTVVGDGEASNERRKITAKLVPGTSWDRKDRRTRYSMIGTVRVVSSFHLVVKKLDTSSGVERCEASGSLQTSHEFGTDEDMILFVLHVRPATFDRYAEMISSAVVTGAELMLDGVAGFYSERSYSYMPIEVKVLTQRKEHVVHVPEEFAEELPRLGGVDEAQLTLSCVRKLGDR